MFSSGTVAQLTDRSPVWELQFIYRLRSVVFYKDTETFGHSSSTLLMVIHYPMTSLFVLVICSVLTRLWIFLRSAARGPTRHRLWVAAPDRRSRTEEREQVGRDGWGKEKKTQNRWWEYDPWDNRHYSFLPMFCLLKHLHRCALRGWKQWPI